MQNDIKTLLWLILIALCISAVVFYRTHNNSFRVVKSSQPSVTGENGTRWEAPLGNTSNDWGHLPLRITTVYDKQRPLDASPWHADGGDWTFCECEPQGTSAVIIIGVRNGQSTHEELPAAWGEAMLAVSGSNFTDSFLKCFSDAFQQPLPKRRMGQPQGFLKIHTAVFGNNLGRLQSGGLGGKGNWTATKWFLDDQGNESEVFFNFSIADKKAEFSEKDPDYREALLSALATALRDGPLPERTLANDPTLTLDGPTFKDWKRLGNTDSFQPTFDHSGSCVYFVAKGKKGSSILYSAPIDHPEQVTQLASVDHQMASYNAIGTNGEIFLLTERIPEREDQISSGDPTILWIVHVGTPAKRLEGPWGDKEWYLTDPPSSPDGRFVTMGKWRTEDRKRTNTMYCLDLESGKSVSINLPAEPICQVIWETEANQPKMKITTGFRQTDNSIHSFLADPVSGVLKPTVVTQNLNNPNHLISPDGTRAAILKERSSLVITNKDGRSAEFNFNDYDRPFASEGCLEWVNSRYLLFHAATPAFIDADTLKISFPLPKDDLTDPELFTPDFTYVVAHRNDGLYIGRVSTGK